MNWSRGWWLAGSLGLHGHVDDLLQAEGVQALRLAARVGRGRDDRPGDGDAQLVQSVGDEIGVADVVHHDGHPRHEGLPGRPGLCRRRGGCRGRQSLADQNDVSQPFGEADLVEVDDLVLHALDFAQQVDAAVAPDQLPQVSGKRLEEGRRQVDLQVGDPVAVTDEVVGDAALGEQRGQVALEAFAGRLRPSQADHAVENERVLPRLVVKEFEGDHDGQGDDAEGDERERGGPTAGVGVLLALRFRFFHRGMADSIIFSPATARDRGASGSGGSRNRAPCRTAIPMNRPGR